jgi:hypothetical protein
VLTSFRFLDNGQPLTDLHKLVSSGDRVTAMFTVASGCQGARVALVSHTMPDPVFVKDHVAQQKIFDSARASLAGGPHTLGPVTVPNCYFQIDFAVFGKGATPAFLYSSATGGTVPCPAADPPRLSWLAGSPAPSPAPTPFLAPLLTDETGDSRTY